MNYRVTVAMNVTYAVDADNPEEAEALALGRTPAEADDIEIIETVVVPEPH